jgi:hypothetical protein
MKKLLFVLLVLFCTSCIYQLIHTEKYKGYDIILNYDTIENYYVLFIYLDDNFISRSYQYTVDDFLLNYDDYINRCKKIIDNHIRLISKNKLEDK